MGPLGIGRELPHRFDIGREPRKAMRGTLLAVEQFLVEPMIHGDAPAYSRRGIVEQCLGCLRRLPCNRNQLAITAAAFLQLYAHSR